ncbi:MAG: hypothetical protein CBB87_01680 [Micavibrio sp. TMED27]|nr:hypothetical protein [Micavibrio sp.]OUT92476.1 MAG: hypothetical protein CBB87_01680 [Micavibrio sp. TMED27]|tara:strand:- start:161 stop:775 length:615 start_codon:yes stop_codon:yes gene_type:complete
MYQNAFTKLELPEMAIVLDRVNEKLGGIEFDPVDAVILAQNISFYPGYRLLEIADHTVMPSVKRYAVYSDDEFFIINFSNEPIYKFNVDLPINLNKENVSDYVRFFFTYVKGKHGRFILTENVDDIPWKEDPPPSARKALGDLIIPITIEDHDEEGSFFIRCCMCFKDSLFKTRVKIQKNGLVSMSEEELLVEDMPVLDDVFAQ